MMSTVGARVELGADTAAALVLAHAWATGAAGHLGRVGNVCRGDTDARLLHRMTPKVALGKCPTRVRKLGQSGH